MFRALLLAPPGAGKGTQGERLAERHGVPHLATGDLLRDHVARNTELGQAAKEHMDAGGLVPDDLVISMVNEALGGRQPREDFLLDGFPRTLPQAEGAYEWGRNKNRTFHAVIMLDVPEDELVRRLVERGRDSGRSDDTEDVIRNRLRIYEENTAPLIDFYEERGILLRIDGLGTVDEVTERVEKGLADLIAD
ncbi:adenylate kinase [Actinospongicola halichondriae]|uniref:adenylate kinase n=1 Tax=Actinospongicola halichondriae TaxID=3236844 RepID=UPI003D501D03